MADEPTDLMQERQRRMEDLLLRIAEDMRDVKSRLTSLDIQFSHVRSDMAHMNERMDRIDSRLDRIERRLELVEQP